MKKTQLLSSPRICGEILFLFPLPRGTALDDNEGKQEWWLTYATR
ncbi:MAG TPA: hypothetical protein VLX68_06960 [Chitinivibrionales bacterium]|nr:hypothetical protein [Chitinivibrionales bacterium]